MKILGKPIAQGWQAEIKNNLCLLKDKPSLGIVVVGDRPESKVYIKMKTKIATELKIKVEEKVLLQTCTTEQVIKAIKDLNHLTGIIVQLPLPKSIDQNKVLQSIPIEKDVDGLSPVSFGYLLNNHETFLPATVVGILRLFKEKKINISKELFTIIGAGVLVGRPLSVALLNRGASVSIIEKNTKDPEYLIKKSKIIISAVGKPGLITKDFMHKGQLIIDAGFSYKSGKPKGDVETKDADELDIDYTPVPGGVGPLTVMGLMYNLVKAAKLFK